MKTIREGVPNIFIGLLDLKMLIVTERQDRNLVFFIFYIKSISIYNIYLFSTNLLFYNGIYIYQTINDDYILEFFKISNFLEEYQKLIERDGRTWRMDINCQPKSSNRFLKKLWLVLSTKDKSLSNQLIIVSTKTRFLKYKRIFECVRPSRNWKINNTKNTNL